MSRILTTHVGSLPRTKELLDANKRRAQGSIGDDEYLQILNDSARDVVAKQLDLGIDIVNEGEYGHAMGEEVNYGAWWNYIFPRLSGLEVISRERVEAALAKEPTDKVTLSEFANRRDWEAFADVYETTNAGEASHQADVTVKDFPAITGEINYVGQDEVARDIKLLKDALAANNSDSRAFVASVSPGSAVRLTNEYYEDADAAVLASAPAMHEEYKAITDAGFDLQLDAPDLAESWDQINPAPTVAGYQDFLKVRVDALNKAIEGLPKEQIRLHICWGSWHGPHSTDIPFGDIIDVLMEANVGGMSFESAGPRHAHEWRVWENRTLPEGFKLYPGVISHNTNALEHPELVADRILRFAELVGPDNVIASSDCGLGGRLHRDLAWAKLDSLVQGAKIASDRLNG